MNDLVFGCRAFWGANIYIIKRGNHYISMDTFMVVIKIECVQTFYHATAINNNISIFHANPMGHCRLLRRRRRRRRRSSCCCFIFAV